MFLGPANRFRGLVVVADVSPNLAGKISHGGENAAREKVPFDLGKPELDLVEPRRMCRREVEMHVRVVEEERANRLGLVGGQIVRDDVNLESFRLTRHDVAKEFDKRGAGVTGDRVRDDFTGLGIKDGQ